MRSGPEAARTILLFHTISARPPKQPRMVRTFLRGYTRGLGWRMHCGVEVTESSTNKQHHLSETPKRIKIRQAGHTVTHQTKLQQAGYKIVGGKIVKVQ